MLDLLNFEGRSVVVTGAARGIGRATAAVFAELGASLVAVDIDPDLPDAVAAEPSLYGGGAVAVVADVSDEGAVNELAARCAAEQHEIAAVVNVVGRGSRAALGELELAEWESVLSTSLTSMFLMTRAFLPLVVPTKGVSSTLPRRTPSSRSRSAPRTARRRAEWSCSPDRWRPRSAPSECGPTPSARDRSTPAAALPPSDRSRR